MRVPEGTTTSRECDVLDAVLTEPAARSQGFGGDTEAMMILCYENSLVGNTASQMSRAPLFHDMAVRGYLPRVLVKLMSNEAHGTIQESKLY